MTTEPTPHRHPFTDLVSGATVTLCTDGDPGVEHPACEHRAPVTPQLDCFYCQSCGWNGRISGAWYLDMIGAAIPPESDLDAEALAIAGLATFLDGYFGLDTGEPAVIERWTHEDSIKLATNLVEEFDLDDHGLEDFAALGCIADLDTCGPVVAYDVDGEPLCARCAQELADEVAEQAGR